MSFPKQIEEAVSVKTLLMQEPISFFNGNVDWHCLSVKLINVRRKVGKMLQGHQGRILKVWKMN
jgi:hypothetical protein